MSAARMPDSASPSPDGDSSTRGTAAPVAGPAVVMLHEGLGSVSMWRDFPSRLSEASGARVLVYSRYGHGRSAPLESPRTPQYLHEEALVALPELLDRLDVACPCCSGTATARRLR